MEYNMYIVHSVHKSFELGLLLLSHSEKKGVLWCASTLLNGIIIITLAQSVVGLQD